jgi:hypothetical protein
MSTPGAAYFPSHRSMLRASKTLADRHLMCANAMVHRVELGKVEATANSREPGFMDRWDAAVKRHFSFGKMRAFLENRSEAGLAKRIRLASSVNSDRRVVEFYGLGVGLLSNSCNERVFKFEVMLLWLHEVTFQW